MSIARARECRRRSTEAVVDGGALKTVLGYVKDDAHTLRAANSAPLALAIASCLERVTWRASVLRGGVKITKFAIVGLAVSRDLLSPVSPFSIPYTELGFTQLSIPCNAIFYQSIGREAQGQGRTSLASGSASCSASLQSLRSGRAGPGAHRTVDVLTLVYRTHDPRMLPYERPPPSTRDGVAVSSHMSLTSSERRDAVGSSSCTAALVLALSSSESRVRARSATLCDRLRW